MHVPPCAVALAMLRAHHQALPNGRVSETPTPVHSVPRGGGNDDLTLIGPWEGYHAAVASVGHAQRPSFDPLDYLSGDKLDVPWTGDHTEDTYPLHVAAADANKLNDLKNLLRDPRVDAQALDANGDTAFTVACLAGNHKAALLLLNYKLSKDQRGDNYDDGLSMADMLWQFMYSFPSLTTRDADVSDYDNAEDDNKLATMFAMIVQTMHETYSGQLDSRLPVYGALLSWTSTEKKSLTDPWLTEAVDGIASEVYDERGRTPLHYAALNPNIKPYVIARLLDTTYLRADMTTTDGNQWTPLHFAAMEGNVGAAMVLLDRGGASINQSDVYGRTALYLAERNGHEDLAEMIRSLGGTRK